MLPTYWHLLRLSQTIKHFPKIDRICTGMHFSLLDLLAYAPGLAAPALWQYQRQHLLNAT
jgi:hypothetical protein